MLLHISFIQYVVCDPGRDNVRHEGKEKDSIFWCRVKSNKEERFKILAMSRAAP